MMNAWWIFPVVGAAIGWATNFLAVKMIFRPRSPVMGVQGLIPRRRRDLAHSIGETVSNHLINKDDIVKLLPLETIKADFKILVGNKVDDFIQKKLIGENPLLATFLSTDLMSKIRQGIVTELEEVLPAIEEKMSVGLENSFDAKSLVIEKVENFDVVKLEKIVLSIAHRELRAIEILGGVIGGLIGGLQVWLLHSGWIQL